MIISRLSGGLGNQMFQAAAGVALARRLNQPLLCDARPLQLDASRNLGLNSFQFDAPILPHSAELTPSHTATALPPLKRGSLSFLLWTIRNRSRVLYVREKELAYHDVLNRLSSSEPRSIYLHGFWQSQQYFAWCGDEIRRLFSFREKPSMENEPARERIRSSKSIAIHVRRGDYVTNPKNRAIYATCSLDYYRRAIAYLVEQLGQEHVQAFVFSDDPDWVQNNLDIPIPKTVIRHNTDSPVEDLRLMSCCQHHVLANSTFSWWGAWLAFHPHQLVVAPRVWYHGRPRVDDSIVPPTWVRLD
ncbi:Glycosyl transferase family 11 [Pirellula sp. SH-Sr6A]|uniref:alpha-1,2-fucosyltransferase n=1 Tax=Pirellula sp. SH-Sr6A TaxID=1632865 RepID=UPI00078DA93B|nr:alpha-1,2-fucosyltransferase [Pirellula sp. SH-Sr6A]AMV31085.1 Glycosyl transferase family 11 [Pirellula sp. SH-Sr6A]